MPSSQPNKGHAQPQDPRTGDLAALGCLANECLLHPFSFLLLAKSPFVGLGLWAAMLLDPVLAGVGLVTLLAIALVSHAFRMTNQKGLSVEYRANGVLAALLGYQVLSPLALDTTVITVGVATTVVITLIVVAFAKAVQRSSPLPISVWPYCLVAAGLLTFLAGSGYDSWPDAGYIVTTPDGIIAIVLAFFEGLGAFLFSPSIFAGAIVASVLALWSPTMFLAGVLSWVSGAMTSLTIASLGVLFDWVPVSFNAFLAGAALGAVFVVPGRKSLLVAVMAGIIASALAAFLLIWSAHHAVAYLPIPLIVTLYAGLLALARVEIDVLTPHPFSYWLRPELAAISADWLLARWENSKGELLAVPLRGNIEVTQGVDGAMTHRGQWRYALDFQRPVTRAEHGEAYRPTLWASEVFAPAEGRIESVRDSVPDNALGTLNIGENWGNYVVIGPDRGPPVMLCHLMAGSVRVKPGQRVSFDTCIGLVGNSGRSASPHLHMQRQTAPDPRSATVPMYLANYFVIDPASGQIAGWRPCGVPQASHIISAASPNPVLHYLLTGMLPGRALWVSEDSERGKAGNSSHFTTRSHLTESGLYRLQSETGDFLEAEVATDAFRILRVAAPQGGFMAALVSALSTVPYAAFAGLTWEDTLYIPRHRHIYNWRELAAPMLGAPLAKTAIKLDHLEDAGRAVLTSKLSLPSQTKGYTAELHLENQRGPTYLRWSGPEGSRAVRLMSFEVAAT